MFGIKYINAFLAKNLKYIIVSLVMIILAIFTDYWIDRTTARISTVSDFFKNTLIIILWLVPFAVVSGIFLKYIDLIKNIRLNGILRRYLVFFLMGVFIILGIVLNMRYSKFTPETEAVLRGYPFINKLLSFFGL